MDQFSKPEAEGSRWFIVISGLIINLCLGSIYSYSVIQVHLRKLFEDLGLRVSATEMQIPFIVFLLFFAITMPIAGKYIEKFGPRKVAYFGAILVGLGWFSASFASSPLDLAVLYGVIGGIGVGVAYNCPIVSVGRWFPDRRGLALGITLFGFGVSAAIIAPVFDFLAVNFGVILTFRILGVLFFILILLFATFLSFPQEGWRPAGWTMHEEKRKVFMELRREEMIRTRQFYGLWASFMIGTLAGLMAIGISKPAGLEVAQNAGIGEAQISILLTALIVPFALCNGIGRPLFGFITDKIGVMRTAILSFSLIFLASLSIFLNPTSIIAYTLSFAILWLNLGGWLAIAPTATAFLFGTKDYARNYGIVYTAYGAGAVIGNLLAGQSKDLFGAYLMVFPFVALLAILGIFVALTGLRTK
ncbi:MAG: OFA family MFS transporter [Archaeoglobaceae archaeon]